MIPFTLRQLTYFDAIAATGSLAAAAERSNVSASALALAIDELERITGMRLLVRRKGKGVILTAAGERVLAQARNVLTEAEVLREIVTDSTQKLVGAFTLGCYPSLSPFYFPGALQHFTRAHPELDLTLTEGTGNQLVRLMLQGGLDAAILYDADVPPEVTFNPLRKVTPAIVLPKAHPLARKSRLSLHALADEPYFQFDMPPSRTHADRIFEWVGVTRNTRMMSSNFEMLRCLIGRELGYTVMFQRPVAEQTYDGGDLAIIEIEDDLPDNFIGIAWPVKSPRSAKHAAVLDYFHSL